VSTLTATRNDGSTLDVAPDHNPKTRAGRLKTPLRFLIPHIARAEAEVFKLGAEKYGPFNWRNEPISASVYYEAALRHLFQWWEGEDIDPESGQTHLAHVRACMAIIMDAAKGDTLQDDRPEVPLPFETPLPDDNGDSMRRALCDWIGCEYDADREVTDARIAKALYTSTDTGITVSIDRDYTINLGAYCEGSEATLPVYRLTWPFSEERFFEAVTEADTAGEAEWNDTHGCPGCLGHWMETGTYHNPDTGELYEVGVNCPVWTECPQCDGEGIVI